jgi:hypothetical protein
VGAIASAAKQKTVARIGATRVRIREADLLAEVGPETVDVVVDTVCGEAFGALIELTPASQAPCVLGCHYRAAGDPRHASFLSREPDPYRLNTLGMHGFFST